MAMQEERLRELKTQMCKHAREKYMKSWSCGDVVATSTVEYWIEQLEEIEREQALSAAPASKRISIDELEKLYASSKTCFDPGYNLFWQNFTKAVNDYFAAAPAPSPLTEEPRDSVTFTCSLALGSILMDKLKELGFKPTAAAPAPSPLTPHGEVINTYTPVSVPLADKSKEELVRIIEMMSEDMQWYVNERNRLLAASPAEQPVYPPGDPYTPEVIAKLAGEQAGALESGWLIESVDSSWLFFRDDHQPDWTHNSLKALRFARKQDAEAVMFALLDVLRVAARATEHRWGL